MEEEFYRLESFLEFFINEEDFTLNILQLVNLIDSKFPNLGWDKKVWEKVIVKTKPPLRNIILLLKKEEIREIKFKDVDFIDLGFHLDYPNMVSYCCIHCFYLICREGKINIVKYWYESDSIKLIETQTASSRGHSDLVKYIRDDREYDLVTWNNRAIKEASSNGHLELVKYLVEEIGCNPKVDDNYPIRWASAGGNIKVVKYLYEVGGCDPKADNNWAIIMASNQGHLELVKYLCEEADCDPTARDNRAIYQASESGHLDVVKYLYEEAGCDARVGDVMIAASGNGHLDVVKYLYEEANCCFEREQSIIEARLFGRQEVVDYLREKID